MNKLEPIHEQAIDLFVAGKRQCEIAKELNVNPRTLRRWGESELFVKELTRQHELNRKLEQDEAQQLRREYRELQRVAMRQVQKYLTEPDTAPELRKHCLTLGLRASQFDIAQEWREFVYFDKKKEKAEKEEAERQDRIEVMKASDRFDAGAALLENLQKLNPEAFAAALAGEAPSCSPGVPPGVDRQESAASASADQPKADKSGHTPSGPGVPPGPKSDGHSSTTGASAAREAAKSGHFAPPPVVKPVQPFRYPRPEKKDAAPAPQVPACKS